MGVIKSMVKEVRRTQDPKAILIDLNSVIYDEQMETREGMIRYWIDNMPDSENKEEVIRTDGRDQINGERSSAHPGS